MTTGDDGDGVAGREETQSLQRARRSAGGESRDAESRGAERPAQ